MQRTQIATLQSFRSYINHRKTELGGGAADERLMERRAQPCHLSDKFTRYLVYKL